MAKKQKPVPEKVRCIDCKHAVLQQWDSNPIIAYCNKRKVRDVAMTIRKCDHYAKISGKPEVMKLKRFNL